MKFWWFILFTFYTATFFAQTKLNKLITPKDGLSQGMIFDMFQDKDGFIWIGTKDGLNCWDGNSFKVFNHDPFDSLSVSSDLVSRLYEDKLGRIWVGTGNGDLNCFDKKAERFYRIPIHKNPTFSKAKNFLINFITEDRHGNIWAGFHNFLAKVTLPDGYPQKADSNKSVVTEAYEFPEPFTSNLTGFFQDIDVVQDSLFWAATFRGLFQLNEESNQFELLDLSQFGEEGSRTSFILEDSKKRIWLGLQKGILMLKGETWHFFPFEDIIPSAELDIIINRQNQLTSIGMEEFMGNFWLWSRVHHKIFILQPDFSSQPMLHLAGTLESPNPNQFIKNICKSETDNFFIGTSGYGFFQYSSRQPSFQHLLSGVSIRSLLTESGGNLWGNGMENYRVFKNGELEKTTFPKLTEPFSGILQDLSGNLWISFNKNRAFDQSVLLQLDDQLNEKNRYATDYLLTDVYGLMRQDQWGNIWFARNTSDLVRFDLKKQTFDIVDYQLLLKIQKAKFSTYAFYKDFENNFWLGKDYGLIRLKMNEMGEIVDYQLFANNPNNRNSLSRNVVLSCLDDPVSPEKYLWVGTKGGGLNRLDKQTGDFLHFTKKNGLPNNVIYGILPDEEGNLWLSSNRGLSKFHPESGNIQNYTVADGLQDDEFNTGAYHKDEKTGKLYFGGINGVTAFHPKDLKPNLFKPPVMITDFKVNNEALDIEQNLEKQAIAYTSKIELPYHQNNLTIEFAALDFTTPENNQYQYILEGSMNHWVQAGNVRVANFSDVAPGEYFFKVKGTNSNGIWNENPAILKITILPPWYRTTWAYALWILLLSTAFYIFYQFQINRVKLQNQLTFEQKEAERLTELNRIKTNFFSNITHEFRTPLTLILEPVRQMLKEDKDGRFAKKLNLVRKNSEKLLQLVNQLLDLSKLEAQQMQLDLRKGDILKTIRPIFQSFLVLADKKGIELKMKVPQDLQEFYFDKDKIEKVVYNLLSNAVKFTEVGNVQLSVVCYQLSNEQDFPNLKNLRIKISDTGSGISETELSKIFDRFYQTDSSLTRENEGTGIGLALTKELIELMGGKITVESKVGAGTVFEVIFPMDEHIDNQGLVFNRVVVEKEKITPVFSDIVKELKEDFIEKEELNPVRIQDADIILIIEDEPDLRKFIKNSLPKNYMVIEASNGEQGIEKAIKFVPDLVVSDLMMPKKDGFEVVETLRREAATSHIPIILLTAKTAIESRIKGIDKGADAYLTKPFNTEELLVRIRKLIEIRTLLQEKYAQNTNISKKRPAQLFSQIDDDFLKKINLIIEENLDNEALTVEHLATKVRMSRAQIHRKLKALTNQSATEFIRNYRLDVARNLLSESNRNVTEVAYMVGFRNQTYFSTKFRERFGKAPSQI